MTTADDAYTEMRVLRAVIRHQDIVIKELRAALRGAPREDCTMTTTKTPFKDISADLAEAQEEKAAAARIEAAIEVLKEASYGQIHRGEDWVVYQPAEIETWVFADDDDLDALGAATLAGEADAYSLWCAQYGETLETPRDMPAETAILEAEVRGLT